MTDIAWIACIEIIALLGLQIRVNFRDGLFDLENNRIRNVSFDGRLIQGSLRLEFLSRKMHLW